MLALAGCGGGHTDTNDYRGEVRSVQERYFADLERFATEATDVIGLDDTAAAKALQQYAAIATRLAAEVAAVKPPEQAADEARGLIAAYRGLASSATGLRTALGAADPQRVEEARTGFNRAQADLVAAIDALNAAA